MIKKFNLFPICPPHLPNSNDNCSLCIIQNINCAGKYRNNKGSRKLLLLGVI